MEKLRKALRVALTALLILVVIPVSVNYVVSPYISEWTMSQEMGSSGYAIVAKEYETLSPAGRAEIRKLLDKGRLLKSDMMRVFDIALAEKPAGQGIQTYPAPDYGDEQEGYDAALWRNLWGKPTVSKAKDKLLQMARADAAISHVGDPHETH